MPGTFSDSWKLTKTSFRLISEDRALLVFPLVAGVSIVAVIGLLIAAEYWFVAPVILGGGSLTTPYEVLAIVLFLAAYIATSFLSVYCTAALIGAATLKLNGQQPIAADGWKVARARLGRLTIWALITATVGLVIQAIQQRIGGIAGAVIGAAGGFSWGILTYFMIPILLFEDQRPWPALKRSGHLFVSTFGKTLVTNLVLGLLIGLGIVGAVIVGVIGLFLLFGGSVALGLVLIGVAIAIVVIVALIGSAAEGILRAALYRYATTGKIDPDLMPQGYAAATGRTSPPLA
jgi:Family of unknown function (DUF6159)